MHSEHAAMQEQLIQAEARAQAAEAHCLELEALRIPQRQLAVAFQPVLAQVSMQTGFLWFTTCVRLLCNFSLWCGKTVDRHTDIVS